MSIPSKKMHGFTLIELMIAVVVVGILTAVALPQYRSYVMRGNRAVAKSALSDLASRQENWLVDHKGYTGTLTKLGYEGNTLYLRSDGRTTTTAYPTDKYVIYKLSLRAASSDGSCPSSGSASTVSYTAVAEVADSSPQARDTSCTSLCISSTGLRGANGSGAASCWTR